MIEYQLEVIALWPRPPKKQLRKDTQDGKGFCRRESRGGLEKGKIPKCEIVRDLWSTLNGSPCLKSRDCEARRCLATKVLVQAERGELF